MMRDQDAAGAADLKLPMKVNEDGAAYSFKRRWPRYPVDIPVRITTHGPTRPFARDGRGTDLNCGGLAVTADIDLAIGAQIAVEFSPPYSDQMLAFRCFVRNRNGNRYGVEFITENDHDYRKAAELQERLAAMQPDTASR